MGNILSFRSRTNCSSLGCRTIRWGSSTCSYFLLTVRWKNTSTTATHLLLHCLFTATDTSVCVCVCLCVCCGGNIFVCLTHYDIMKVCVGASCVSPFLIGSRVHTHRFVPLRFQLWNRHTITQSHKSWGSKVTIHLLTVTHEPQWAGIPILFFF